VKRKIRDLQQSSDIELEINYAAWLPQERNAAILDCGCGDGRLLRFLSAKGYVSLQGVDRDPSSIAAIGPLSGCKVDCVEVDLDYLRSQRGRFKLIVCKQMIYYIDRSEIIAFMAALKDALCNDGVLIIEFFNGSLLSSRLTELKDPFIRTAYTEHSMRRIFASVSLCELYMGAQINPNTGKLFSIIYVALRGVWTSLLKAVYILERGLDNEIPRLYSKSIIAVAAKQKTSPAAM
jgi:2-polyprenyl-3-methyl-5-hydroxy-6-metoxy-1,4-benzoquinol methylase